MSSVYGIKKEFFEIQQLIDVEEFDEETGELIDNSLTIKQLLKEIEDNQSNKADNIVYLIKQAKDTQDLIKAEIDRLNGRNAMFKRQEDSLKELLTYLVGGEKLKTDKFTISFRSSQSVNIIDADLIPAEFLNVKETFTPDKKLIKEALADFNEVPGAEIKINKSIGIK